jgi:hypothetical protein
MKPVRALLIASHAPNITRLLQGLRNGTSFLFKNQKNVTGFSHPPWHGRHLLGLVDEVESEIRSMPYYAQMKSMTDQITLPTVNASIASALAQSWLQDGFVWRKTVFQGSCPPVQITWGATSQVVRVLQRYYAHFVQIHTPRNIPRSFRDTLPDFHAPSTVTPLQPTHRSDTAPLGSIRSMGAAVLGWGLGAAGMTWDDVVWFLSDPCDGKDCTESNRWTLTYVVESLAFCDFESVMYCSGHRRDMVSSTLFAAVLYMVVSVASTYLGVPAVGNVFFYFIPLFVLWYSTGTAPACLPMVPTCLLDDLLVSYKSLFPVSASIPPAMMSADNKTLRSCEELQFTTWRDPLAFALCELGMCGFSVNATFLPGLYWDATAKQAQVNSPDVTAYRLCALISAVNSLPVLLIVSLGLVFLSSVVLTVLNTIPPLLTMAWHVVGFNHAGAYSTE